MSGVLVRAFERRSTLDETTGWGLIKKLRGGIGETGVGINVTPDTALRYSQACTNVRLNNLFDSLSSRLIHLLERSQSMC